MFSNDSLIQNNKLMHAKNDIKLIHWVRVVVYMRHKKNAKNINAQMMAK